MTEMRDEIRITLHLPMPINDVNTIMEAVLSVMPGATIDLTGAHGWEIHVNPGSTVAVEHVVVGMDRDDLRRYALSLQTLHDSRQQADNSYNDRCEHCHFTRHPCDVHELASAVLELLGKRGES